jgi:short chain enoyl-CoA hydratase (EC 4.2.1.17)/3-hydroxyacyl-CoA dehydrogenase (EC 1.1.1.35)
MNGLILCICRKRCQKIKTAAVRQELARRRFASFQAHGYHPNNFAALRHFRGRLTTSSQKARSVMYEGKALKLLRIDNGIVELCFDREGESINKFDAQTIGELNEAAQRLAAASDVRGLLVSSGKDGFIVGADITEFGRNFQLPEEELVKWVLEADRIFSAIEDLPFPSVTAINGIALGGGFEMCLATDYRVMVDSAQVGLPEIKLGSTPDSAARCACRAWSARTTPSSGLPAARRTRPKPRSRSTPWMRWLPPTSCARRPWRCCSWRSMAVWTGRRVAPRRRRR